MKAPLWFLFFGLLVASARACIWDADTLADERAKSPDMAAMILGHTNLMPNLAPLRERIKKLEADPHRDDPMWWNDLAGAHLRLGEASEAVQLLNPVVARFPNDYGIHANLGTAYHLLGRYAEAEKEIARDLEINPEGHFGLEKYHLALLQYLVRDADYQSRHVFVDEFTQPFIESSGPVLFRAVDTSPDTNPPVGNLEDLKKDYLSLAGSGTNFDSPLSTKMDETLQEMVAFDAPPPYRAKWNLGTDTNFQNGVLYMASMNPKEPACFVMLGIASWKNRDLNLAATAFEKAVELGSPQSEMLRRKVMGLRDHIHKAQMQVTGTSVAFFWAAAGLICGMLVLLWLLRKVTNLIRA